MLSTSNRGRSVAGLALVAIALVVYLPALSGPFLLDDHTNLPQTALERFDLGKLLAIATANESGVLGRPIPVLTFALNHLLSDGGPTAFKLTNLVLHLVNGLLVYLLALQLLRRLADDAGHDVFDLRAAALLAAALWLLHPLQLSTVMYVVQRMTMTMAGFTLGALILYARLRDLQLRSGDAHLDRVPPVALMVVLAVLSKENGALAIVHILLLESVVFRFRTHRDADRARFLAAFAALVAAPVAIGALYFGVHHEALLQSYANRDFDMTERLRTQPVAILLYLKMILAPTLSDMVFYHDGFPVLRETSVLSVGAAAVVGAMVAGVPLLARRAPVVALGIGLFVVSHLMESTLLPLELVFEHRNYVGLLGPSLIVAWYAMRLAARPPARAATLLASTALVAFLAFQSAVRAADWGSEIGINAFAATHAPASTRARTNLAISLTRAGRVDEALTHLERSARPGLADAHVPLLMLRTAALSGSPDATLTRRARERLRGGPITSDVAQVLGHLHDARERGERNAPDLDTLLSLFGAALDDAPSRLTDRQRAVLLVRRAAMETEADRRSAARRALEEAATLSPEDPEIWTRLAERLTLDGLVDPARAALRRIERLAPSSEPSISRRVRAIEKRLDALERQLTADTSAR